MINLILEKKTGFEAFNPFTIYDDRNIEFYNSNFTKTLAEKGKSTFNLPAGKYIVNGFIHKLPQPVFYEKITLPPKERILKNKRFHIKFGNNKKKCTIFHKIGLIVFDHSLRKAPQYILWDIYFHELGHQFYKTEEYADRYATNRMLDIGFNPSQIGRALVLSLSSKNFDRKISKINSLNKFKNIK